MVPSPTNPTVTLSLDIPSTLLRFLIFRSARYRLAVCLRLRKASAEREMLVSKALALALPKRIDLHDKYRRSLQNKERAMRPLEGLFVLDFSTLLPGPLATLLLAEAGAEVVKIEPPRGEEMRGRSPKWGHDSAGFALLNRGKRSVAIDLKNTAERARLQPLVERADVNRRAIPAGRHGATRARLRDGGQAQSHSRLLFNLGIWANRAQTRRCRP